MTYPRTVQIRQTRPFRPSFCCVLPPPHPPFLCRFSGCRLPTTHCGCALSQTDFYLRLIDLLRSGVDRRARRSL